MHIPKGDTALLELVRFDNALEAALAPAPNYDASRWLYVPNTYGEYRYILGTRGGATPDLRGGEPVHRHPRRFGSHPEIGGTGGPPQRV